MFQVKVNPEQCAGQRCRHYLRFMRSHFSSTKPRKKQHSASMAELVINTVPLLAGGCQCWYLQVSSCRKLHEAEWKQAEGLEAEQRGPWSLPFNMSQGPTGA